MIAETVCCIPRCGTIVRCRCDALFGWETALDRAAAVFRSLIERYGPDSVGFYVSGQCLTEEYYVANKLMKGFIGSNTIDSNSRLCMSTGCRQLINWRWAKIVYRWS